MVNGLSVESTVEEELKNHRRHIGVRMGHGAVTHQWRKPNASGAPLCCEGLPPGSLTWLNVGQRLDPPDLVFPERTFRRLTLH